MTELATRQQPEALSWRINDLHIAGMAWGDPRATPVLALHGWLDNAASFARLAPLLEGFYVVALDLTGHGQSAHRAADASYQIWDDLPEILGVLDMLGWETFHLMGHSRGAIIAALLASSFPERVQGLVLLDALSPQGVPESEFPSQLRKALMDKPRLLGRRNREFADMEEAVSSRLGRGLEPQAARLLVERNLRTCDGGVTWSTDARLHGASAVKLTSGQIQAVLTALEMPTLLLLAEDSTLQMPNIAEYARTSIPDLRLLTLPGGHHLHMGSGAGDVARSIEQFLISIEECEPA